MALADIKQRPGIVLGVAVFVGMHTANQSVLFAFNRWGGSGGTALGAAKSAPGRMEVLGGPPRNPWVIVDYAHTPDGLENVLETVKEFAEGQVYCVFGCGGDRDRKKRPLMGEAAGRGSDLAIVTSDMTRPCPSEKLLPPASLRSRRRSKISLYRGPGLYPSSRRSCPLSWRRMFFSWVKKREMYRLMSGSIVTTLAATAVSAAPPMIFKSV